MYLPTMADLKGFTYPRTPTGVGSVLPDPPWHYSGDMLTVEFRTDPARVAELLPDGLEPADDDRGLRPHLGLVAELLDSFEELLDPARSCTMRPSSSSVASTAASPTAARTSGSTRTSMSRSCRATRRSSVR